MLAIRSGKGLGDNLYLQSVARHFVNRGQEIEVCTLWPDVFLPLNGKILVSPFRRDRISYSAHYINRKHIAETDQFVDCCINCGIGETVELRLDWKPLNKALIASVKRSGKPLILVQLPRAPMGRSDGYGDDLLPDCRRIQRAIDHLNGRAFIVQVGSGKPLYEFTGLDLDLANHTTVTDLIDVASAADAALGYCSFIVPLAESLRKPVLLMWSRRGLRSSNEFIRAITPQKIMHRKTSHAVIDDCSDLELREAVDALCEQARCPVAV